MLMRFKMLQSFRNRFARICFKTTCKILFWQSR